MEITIKNYPDKAKKLIEIWENQKRYGTDFIIFTNKRPKRPRNDNRRIAGLKAVSLMYLRDDTELIQMSVENFIYLMAKCGVDIEVREVERTDT